MRVLTFTIGTRGDIDPYAVLTDRLNAAGHQATLAVPESHRGVVADPGAFLPVGTEMDEAMRAGMADTAGPVQALTLARRLTAAMRVSLEEQWEAAQEIRPDIIVAHPKALGGVHIAEKLDIPAVPSIPSPFLTPTRAFPVPLLDGPVPAGLNKASYGFNRSAAMAYGGMVNTFRTHVLGIPRVSRFSDYLHSPAGARLPTLYPFSRHVVPVPADYPGNAHVTGYWLRDEDGDGDFTPPAELADFLARPDPAVYIGFGSMAFGRKADARGRLVMDAVQAAGIRAVVATGWGGVAAHSTDRVLVVDAVPHSWLFSRVAAVVHHGGSGTTAAGLRAGRPTLICPALGDQPFWGRRVADLGAGPEALPLKRATVDSLAHRLRALLGEPRYAARAETIAQRLRDEDGPGQAVRTLEEIHACTAA